MKVLAIAMLNLRRLFRERTNIFYVVISPLLFVLVLGLLFGGGQPLRLAVTGADGGPLAQHLASALAADGRVELTHVDSDRDLRTAVERGTVNAGLVIPDDYDAGLRSGQQTAVHYLTRPDDLVAAELGVWVRSVVPQEAALLRAARFGADRGDRSFEHALRAAESMPLRGSEVVVVNTGERQFPAGLNQFAPIAPSLLLLFVFLTSLTAALGLIEARRLGVTSRMYATPTPPAVIVAGEALGRLAIALAQGLVVVLGTGLLFGVDWGDPLGAAALLLLFCLVGSGAAMLLGSLFRSEGPALGVAMALGLGLAGVGGTMLPLELLSEPMQRVARFTPHAWGYEGFAELVRHGGRFTDILPQLGVLAAFAVVLFGLGVWRLRRSITG
jgi:ABC-2 type transport system permease protein